MLRMYFVQHWSQPGRRGVRRSAAGQHRAAPLRGHRLGASARARQHHAAEVSPYFEGQRPGRAAVRRRWPGSAGRGLKLGTGTIVDATIIGAPSSTKNADKARDPEMHQTRKGSAVVLRHEAAHRVDSRTGLIAQRRGHHKPTCTTSTAARSAARRRAASMATAPRQPEAAYRSPRAPQARTSPTSAHAGAAHRRGRARRTAPSPRCAPASSTCSAWSSGNGGSTKVRYRGWPRTPRAVCGAGSGQHLPRAKNTIWTGASIAHDKRANGSRRGRKGLGKWRNARQNRTAAPEIPPNRASRARSLLDGAWRLLVQRCLKYLRGLQSVQWPIAAVSPCRRTGGLPEAHGGLVRGGGRWLDALHRHPSVELLADGQGLTGRAGGWEVLRR